MTLNQLFAEINHHLGHVNTIVRSITSPDMYWIDKYLKAALSLGYVLDDNIQYGRYYVDRVQSEIIRYILWSYKRVVEDYYVSIEDLRLAMNWAFINNYEVITHDIEDAIQIVSNDINDSESYLIGEINKINTGIAADIEARAQVAEAKAESSVTEAKDWLWGKITDLTTVLADKVTEIYNYISGVVSGWVDKFNSFYTQITDWVSGNLAVVYERLRIETSGLLAQILDYYDKAKDLVNAAKAYLVSKINALDETLRAWVNLAIAEVQNLLTDLSMLSDWRFQFFNLALSYPELGFLQVLNRNDETFNRFKPYWQALFARVMEEE